MSEAEARRRRGRPARIVAWALVAIGAILLLAAPLAHAFGVRFAVISGGSMSPTLQRGDVLVLGKAPAALDVGDLAVVGLGETAYVHRVIHAEDGLYVLQGDANAEADHRRVPHSEITGQVLHRIAAPFAIPAAAAMSGEGKICITLGSIALVLWAALTGRRPAGLAPPESRTA